MEMLVEGDALKGDWQQLLLDHCATSLPQEPELLLGWSTGAMVAWVLAPLLKPRRMVLLAPTPTFCRRDEFRFGTRPKVLQSMRSALSSDRRGTLERFWDSCGLPPSLWPPSLPYTTDQLRAGLVFLEHASLLPLAATPCPLKVFHGSADRIISVEAGKFFAHEARGEFVQQNCEHFVMEPFAAAL
jgi:surfactin synthase thioesterase subunit